MIRRLLRTLALCLAILSPTIPGWEVGMEYLYEYSGRAVTGLRDNRNQTAAVQIHSRLTVQSTDDNTLMLKLSEVRIKRHGNYGGGDGPSDRIWLPDDMSGAEEESVGDFLHLLSPFTVVHNKGSIVNLIVEGDEPAWSVNMKKAVASQLQLDITGVRSGLDGGGVFGERTAALNSLEDGVTGECLTTLRTTRLPFYQALLDRGVVENQAISDTCRSANIYEVVKMKDYEQCRTSPVDAFISPPAGSSCSSGGIHCDGALQRSSVYKYLTCGESSERATLVRLQGYGSIMSSGSFAIKVEQIVGLVLQSRGQMHQLLPALTRPKVVETLTYAFDDAPTIVGGEPDAGELFEVLQQVARTLSAVSDDDIPERLGAVSRVIFRLDAPRLRQIWQRSIAAPTIRSLFVDCVAASGSHNGAAFLMDLIEQREIQGVQAVMTLMSAGHSVQSPNTAVLRRFVGIIRSDAARVSKPLRMTAFTVAAELLYSWCVAASAGCHPDAQVITEDYLPLIVAELEVPSITMADRLTLLTALGALGTDDVLLLLVPYIRGEEIAARIAAIFSLKRLMDSSPEKVIPILTSLADNVAERPELRMAAISILLLHQETPSVHWKKIASRTWFEPSRQVHIFTYALIRSLAEMHSPADESISSRARSVIDLARPCSVDRRWGSFKLHSTPADGALAFLSLLSSWKVNDASLPVYLHHQLFHQLGSFRFNLVQASVWNYNMEEVWSQLLGTGRPKGNGAKLSDLWDQLTLRSPPEDKRAGLLHVKLMGSTLQGFFNLEQIDPDMKALAGLLLTGRLNIDAVKFQPLVDIRTIVPTELGLPAQFRLSMPLLASAQGLMDFAGKQVNVTSALWWKSISEARVLLPFSRHYVAAGVDVRAGLNLPLRITLNGSSLQWHPPDKTCDLIYYHVKPYTTSRSGELNVLSTRPAVASVAQLGNNFTLEMSSERPQQADESAAAWRDLSALHYSNSFAQRAYRVRYAPGQPALRTISMSAAMRPQGDNSQLATTLINDDALPLRVKGNIHLFQSSITAYYENGSTTEWNLLTVETQRMAKRRMYNVSASGYSLGLLQRWMGSGAESTPQLLSFQVEECDWLPSFQRIQSMISSGKTSRCTVEPEGIVTYDGVAYNYSLNGCHHILTADCGRKAFRYAVTASAGKFHGMVVRLTLENDVIDITTSGNVSINGAPADSTANRMRVWAGDKIIAIITRGPSGDVIHLQLPEEDLEVIVDKRIVTLQAGGRLLGRTCGLCGDGDDETTGEFKTADRCALSSGRLMAASYQVSVDSDECPAVPDDTYQALQRESYPCYSVDEQVASSLPLPPES